MPHQIIETEAFVVSVNPRGDRNIYARFLTRELGLIGAEARGVRCMESKLRSHLQAMTHGKICLVRGRESWKIVGAESTDMLARLYADRKIYATVARILGISSRVINGESGSADIFDLIRDSVQTIVSEKKHEIAVEIELATVAKLLCMLGYIEDGGKYTQDFVRENKKTVINDINNALRASHL